MLHPLLVTRVISQLARRNRKIGYVPAGPYAFFRWSGQFGPQQLILYWPAGPVDFFFLLLLLLFIFILGLPFIFENCYEGGS